MPGPSPSRPMCPRSRRSNGKRRNRRPRSSRRRRRPRWSSCRRPAGARPSTDSSRRRRLRRGRPSRRARIPGISGERRRHRPLAAEPPAPDTPSRGGRGLMAFLVILLAAVAAVLLLRSRSGSSPSVAALHATSVPVTFPPPVTAAPVGAARPRGHRRVRTDLRPHVGAHPRSDAAPGRTDPDPDPGPERPRRARPGGRFRAPGGVRRRERELGVPCGPRPAAPRRRSQDALFDPARARLRDRPPSRRRGATTARSPCGCCPSTTAGRDCYRVFWGRFPSLDAARRAKSGVPSYFVTAHNHPAVVSVR